ncbi:hypothetical protein ACFLVR_05525 [Chloroflexota bacterium]
MNEISEKKDVLVEDMEFITTTALAANVEVSSITYLDNTMTLQCPTDSYKAQPNYYLLVTNTFEHFEESIIENNRFLSAIHDPVPSQVPDSITVTITVNPNA